MAPDRVAIVEALAKLPPKHRLAVVLRSGELPRPDGVVRAFAYDLSDDGTAVGWDGGSRALVWTADGAVRALPGPQGLKVSAIAINGPWVVGAAAQPQGLDLPGSGQQAIRWDLRTGDYAEIPDILLAVGVTPRGWVLAHARVEIKDSTTRSRFLHPPLVQMPGKRIALPSPAGANQDDAGAQVVSDDGRTIAGEGKLPGSGHGTVIRWTCS
ncbi:hypothetical protein [Allorhizocola rhizosphaerae]|uniref:hypothetical protein n=1 Tax=Allorhizocola rhizosphaerae TaxID=1872709 RepID=UPI000E3E2CEC|nr:hypothetical protein [Allorhizocola rhizosphaerae]